MTTFRVKTGRMGCAGHVVEAPPLYRVRGKYLDGSGTSTLLFGGTKEEAGRKMALAMESGVFGEITVTPLSGEHLTEAQRAWVLSEGQRIAAAECDH